MESNDGYQLSKVLSLTKLMEENPDWPDKGKNDSSNVETEKLLINETKGVDNTEHIEKNKCSLDENICWDLKPDDLNVNFGNEIVTEISKLDFELPSKDSPEYENYYCNLFSKLSQIDSSQLSTSSLITLSQQVNKIPEDIREAVRLLGNLKESKP